MKPKGWMCVNLQAGGVELGYSERLALPNGSAARPSNHGNNASRGKRPEASANPIQGCGGTT